MIFYNHNIRLDNLIFSKKIKLWVLKAIVITCGFCYSSQLFSQQLKNGDLEGDFDPTQISQLPDHWLSVPFDDDVCQASEPETATPDQTGINGPSPGQPYSGKSFVRGVFLKYFNTFNQDSLNGHEGIMQRISGFNVNCIYKVSFAQAVFVSFMGLDTSGIWAVYLDDSLIGKSLPSSIRTNYNNPNPKLWWEKREIIFTPSQSVHTLKFLPFNLDYTPPFHDGVPMAIDDIRLEKIPTRPELLNLLPNDTSVYPGGSLSLVTGIAHTFWNTGYIGERIVVTKPGTYWYNIEEPCYTYSDTIIITSEELSLHIPNAFTPNGDGLNDHLEFWIYGVEKYNASIYNRWGQVVYKKEGGPGLFNWDGKVNGKEAMPGVYSLKIIVDSKQINELIHLIR